MIKETNCTKMLQPKLQFPSGNLMFPLVKWPLEPQISLFEPFTLWI